MKEMINVVAVGTGGFVGAASRYFISTLVNKLNTSGFPIATLIINILGSFLIGLLTQLLMSLCPDNKKLNLFLTTGILGGFTTFSTFSLETVNLFQGGKAVFGVVNIVLSIAFCLTGVVLGKMLAKTIASM
ncbi:fluoride efflux transporter CrcB [Ruminiclostridium cellulolyticum]|uniref:Fluoride-specific ion channel FluC n=1 Tax=Ruminiclostridium cellulolyticum (strain ATCC 35319 / DSM 5812 / JCM 6584 / H10) TaxID=394503 RepID=FLUC_RUMCH|nr:fluoride efflux transporter CrcB [Ruminiclostridium cellulolyticum]B8I378.1 RecName: Full=Fluoride-specific ion channel FluC [Ruminiclostridium cellulolyticum H10]ACL76221.1 CrcB protein [Ruminiclostridium cellulolyticum H10]